MKNTVKIAIGLIVIFSFIANVQLYRAYKIEKDKLDSNIQTKTKFVWNDTDESIPRDGSLITLEFGENGIIYIGPYNQSSNYIVEAFDKYIVVRDPDNNREIYREEYNNKNSLSNAILKDNE